MKALFGILFFHSILLVLRGAVLYSPVLDNWYSEFAGDDDWMVYENRHVFNLSPENIAEYFTGFYRGQYSPVNTLAYGIIYYFFGIDPASFHAFSLVLHLANVLLVLYFVSQLIIFTGKVCFVREGRHDLWYVGFCCHPTPSYSSATLSGKLIIE